MLTTNFVFPARNRTGITAKKTCPQEYSLWSLKKANKQTNKEQYSFSRQYTLILTLLTNLKIHNFPFKYITISMAFFLFPCLYIYFPFKNKCKTHCLLLISIRKAFKKHLLGHIHDIKMKNQTQKQHNKYICMPSPKKECKYQQHQLTNKLDFLFIKKERQSS